MSNENITIPLDVLISTEIEKTQLLSVIDDFSVQIFDYKKKSSKEDRFFTKILEYVMQKTLLLNDFTVFDKFCSDAITNKFTNNAEIESFLKKLETEHRCYIQPTFSSYNEALSFISALLIARGKDMDSVHQHDISQLISHSQRYYHSSSPVSLLKYTFQYDGCLSSAIGHNRFVGHTFSGTDLKVKNSVGFFKLILFKFHIPTIGFTSFFEEIIKNNNVVINLLKSKYQFHWNERVNFAKSGFIPEILFPVNEYKNDIAITILPSVNMINYIQYLVTAKRYHGLYFKNGNYQVVGSNAQNVSEHAAAFGGQLKTIAIDLAWYRTNQRLLKDSNLRNFDKLINFNYLKDTSIPNKNKKKYLLNFGEQMFVHTSAFWRNKNKKLFEKNTLIADFLSKKLDEDQIDVLKNRIFSEYQNTCNIFLENNIKNMILNGIENGIYIYLMGDME